MPLQYLFGWRIIKAKKENTANTQARGAYFQELLPAMKLVKYYAWEQFFERQIDEVRRCCVMPAVINISTVFLPSVKSSAGVTRHPLRLRLTDHMPVMHSVSCLTPHMSA